MKQLASLVLAIGLLTLMATGVVVGFILAAADFIGWVVA